VVVGGEDGGVLVGEAGDPGGGVRRGGVEVGSAWDDGFGEEMCVALGGNGRGLGDGVLCEVAVDVVVADVDVAVGG
jgi:hypothetical protein